MNFFEIERLFQVFSNSRRENDTYDLSFMVLLPKQPGTELENMKGFLLKIAKYFVVKHYITMFRIDSVGNIHL